MLPSASTLLVDAILDTREREALRLAAQLLNSGLTLAEVEGLCSEAMQVIGSQFRPDTECIEEIVVADWIISEILRSTAPASSQ